MIYKPEDICSKPPPQLKKCEGVIDYKIIRKIHHKIQANASTILSELGGLFGMAMQPATYQTGIENDFHRPSCFPQASPVHPASCVPSGPMEPNVNCGRYPETATYRTTG